MPISRNKCLIRRNGKLTADCENTQRAWCVDFVITDINAYIRAIVELKDEHDKKRFVDDVLTSVGYRVIRVDNITENILKNI